MWVEFVVGSRPYSEGFSPCSPVFLPLQKPTFLNSNSIGNLRATGLSAEDCCVSPSLNKVDLFNITCNQVSGTYTQILSTDEILPDLNHSNIYNAQNSQ